MSGGAEGSEAPRVLAVTAGDEGAALHQPSWLSDAWKSGFEGGGAMFKCLNALLLLSLSICTFYLPSWSLDVALRCSLDSITCKQIKWWWLPVCFGGVLIHLFHSQSFTYGSCSDLFFKLCLMLHSEKTLGSVLRFRWRYCPGEKTSSSLSVLFIQW